MADYNDILRRAIQVRDAVLEGSNTASLVGGVMVDTLYLTKGLVSDINNIIDSLKNLGSSTGGSGSIDEEQLIAFLTTLQGYFTNGSAKKALQLTNARKLWGNSFNGTADINGSIIVPDGKNITIGNIKMEYDATNKALKITNTTTNEVANLYTSGGISAYGVGTASSSGGGLNGSVISYARIIEGNYTDADLTSIPNAYAIKALSSRIDNIATELGGLNLSWNNITGKPSTFAPSAHTHKWTEITDRITKVSQLTNDAGYLTAHQSLASYYTKAEIDAKGYTTNKGTVTSVALTLPTGLVCATKTITTSGTFAISLASGYSIPTTAKQAAWDGAVSAKHTHSNKSVLDGISSTKVSHWNSAYDWYALMTTDEETADGIINKWNEVVSFLANIAQTDTLSGIVDGINKSISDEVTRAKKAEGVNASGISTNKTNITTLQGYFTSGSAKKALQLTNARKLWGNSFNGTADINGSIIVPDGKYISIGNIKMEYDATNKALKITNTTTNEVANLYTSGGVSAYGVGTSSSSGGGLNGSVKSYADALKLTSESLSEIASAYSIKALDTRISSLEGGSATAISVSGSGNAVTSVTKNGTTISVVKGSTFLTSHQSLDGYVNAISVSGSGNAITSVSKSGKTITFTKGSTFLTSHQSLSAYLKSADAANTYSKLGHTHSYAGSASAGGDATRALKLKDYNGSLDIYCGFSGASLLSGEIGYMTGIKFVDNIVYYKDVSKGELQKWLNLGARAYDNTSYLPITGGTLTGNLNGTTAVFCGRINNSGDDEGILIKKAPNNFAGLILGSTDSDRSCFYLGPNGAFWKYVENGSEGSVQHPRKNGTMALTSDIPTKVSSLSNDSGYITSSGSCAYATSAGNADTVDGVHVTWSGEITSTNWLVEWENDGSAIRAINPAYVSVGNADKLDGIHATNGDTKPWGTIPAIHPSGWMDIGKQLEFHFDNTTGSDYSTVLRCTGNYSNDVHLPSSSGTLALISDNVASATKLQTPRTIWGQSFDGTGNVNGTIYINNSNSSNGAIRLNSDISSNARISAIGDQVIFNTGNAIRFGETAWDFNEWAGLKYTHSNKTIYLGIADGSAFYANSAQRDGTLRLAGITTITPNSGARIGNSGADLYLGNASNSAWVKVQDICSQTNSSLWSIRQDGNAYFKSININSGATFNGPVKVNNMLTARAIMFTTTDSNVYGTSLQNWDGSIGAHVTNMFNGIDSNNISVEYSTNGGSSWLTYTANPNSLFNLINDNSDTENFFLGNNVMNGNSDADKLTQIKKNQLRVTIKIPTEVYQELSWISVDVNNGVNIKCQVYFGNSSGVYTEYVSKVLIGWPHRCDICVGPINVGNDSYRYVRLVFSHLSGNTALRNGIISRIRALALTKYSNGSGRYNISTTGHIYNYDYNMNTYFPNSILAKGGVTAYQSSDIRLKQDLRKLDYFGIIKAMGGTFGFAWKKDNTRSIGWIAQHVLCNPHLKDIVETDEKGYYKINYWSPKLIATAFGAIEQVGDEVSRLKARVVFLESEVQRLSGDKKDCNKKRLDNKNINSLN